jgi:ATP-dependent Clp protease ATP-binding subunit ClpA
MFERFHHDAKAALARARDEADRDGDGEVGTGHLLLGLLARPGDAADALKAAGASLTELRARIPRDGSPDTDGQDPGQAAEVAAAPDAAAADAPAADASAADARAADASAADAGAADAGAADAGAADAGAADAGAADAGAADAGAADAGAADAGQPNAAEPVRPEEVRLTREARRALERAQKTAQRLKHQRVSTGHVLLGIIDQPDDPTVGALSVVGIRVGTLRADVLRRMETADPGGPGARGTGPGNDPGD